MLVESLIRLSNVIFVVVANSVARAKMSQPKRDQPRLLDLVREWWKSHPALHKVNPNNIRSKPAANYKYELRGDFTEAIREDPSFGIQCDCCDIWWVVVHDGVMKWAYYKESDPRHEERICSVADPKFLEHLEHALKNVYHPG